MKEEITLLFPGAQGKKTSVNPGVITPEPGTVTAKPKCGSFMPYWLPVSQVHTTRTKDTDRT